MKRFLIILLALITVLTFAACGGDTEKPESTDATSKIESVDESSEAEGEVSSIESDVSSDTPEKYAPLVLLEEGKVEEAYKLLIADKDNEQAQELLSKINVVFTKQSVKDESFGEISFEYEYDSNGNMTKRVYKTNGKESNTLVAEYGENGNLIIATLTFSFGDSDTMEWIYNPDGSVKERIEKDLTTGEIIMITAYEYNDAGLTSKETRSNNYETVSVTEYIYDENGNTIKVVTSSPDGSEMSYEYYYDENGRQTGWKENLYSVTRTVELQYDENGLVIERTSYNEDGSVYVAIDYFYDEVGNLVKDVQNVYYGAKIVTDFSGYKYFYYPDGIPNGIKFNLLG